MDYTWSIEERDLAICRIVDREIVQGEPAMEFMWERRSMLLSKAAALPQLLDSVCDQGRSHKGCPSPNSGIIPVVWPLAQCSDLPREVVSTTTRLVNSFLFKLAREVLLFIAKNLTHSCILVPVNRCYFYLEGIPRLHQFGKEF